MVSGFLGFRRRFRSRGAVVAAAHQIGDLLAALGRDLTGRRLDLEGLERGADHVVGVRRTGRLAHDVLDAEGFEHGAHRTARDDAGPGRGGAHHDLAGAPTAVAVVVQGAVLAERNADHGLLGFFRRLADGFRHFARLAVTEADAALAVADDHQGREREPAAAFDGGCDAVDVNQLLDDVRIRTVDGGSVAVVTTVAIVAAAAALGCLRHLSRPLEVQAGFTRGISQRLHPSVIDVAAAIEDDVLDALLDGAFGDQLADQSSSGDVRTLDLLALLAFQRGSGGDRDAVQVVDDLGRDVLVRTVHRQAQTAVGDSLQAAAGALRTALGLLSKRKSHDLLLLAFLAPDLFARVAHALALVGLRRTQLANDGCDLTHGLLVGAGDLDFRLLGHREGDAGGRFDVDVVREAELQRQGVALHRGAVTDADQVQALFKAGGDADDHVVDQGAGQAPHGARTLVVLADGQVQAVVALGDFDLFSNGPGAFALGTLHRDGLAVERDSHALRDLDGAFSDTGHLSRPCRGLRRPPWLREPRCPT